MEYVQPYLDYFAAHPDWAIVVVFLIAFGEALLIIGLFVPSTAVLVGAGILVGTGHLPFWPVALATAIGAIAGDQISYWAGRLFGERLKTMWPLNRYPQLVARGEEFVRSHGGKSIAIGRFVPGVKAVVPGIVGMFGMGQLYFAAVNFSSGLVWAAAHVLPGMLIGQGLAFAGELSGRLVFVLIVLLVILAIAGYLIRLLAAGLSPYLGHVLGGVSAWAKARNTPSMRRFARAVSPENPRSLLVVLFAAIVVAGAIALGSLAIRVSSNDAVSNADVSIFNLMKEMRNAPADELMITLTMLGDGVVLTALALAIIAWLAWHKAYRAALAAAIAVVAGKIFVPVLKYAIQRPRPIELYAGAETFSFPSGHATMAALIFGILAVLVSHTMGRWSRSLVYAACGVFVIAIAYSRVYLGVHWLSDVLGGLMFGAVMAAAFGVAIEAIPPRRIRPIGLIGFSALVMLGVGGAHVAIDYGAAEEAYGPRQRAVVETYRHWQGGGWRNQPVERIDLAGTAGEAFLAQFVGSADTLRLTLAAAGWQETPKWTWRDAVPYLNPQASFADLAPRPALHEGLKARLTMVRPIDERTRDVLRVFKTDNLVLLRDRRLPLYLVSLARERDRRSFNLYAVPRPLPARAEDRASFTAFLDANRHVLRVAADGGEAPSPALFLAVRP